MRAHTGIRELSLVRVEELVHKKQLEVGAIGHTTKVQNCSCAENRIEIRAKTHQMAVDKDIVQIRGNTPPSLQESGVVGQERPMQI